MTSYPKKTTKKKNSQRTKSTAELSAVNVTVRECLVWPDNQTKKKSTTGGGGVEPVYVSMRAQREVKAAAQESDQSSPTTQHRQPPPPPHDDGTVIEALRGWSRHKSNIDETTHDDDEDDRYPTYEPPSQAAGDKIKPEKPPKSSTTQPKRKVNGSKSTKRTVIKEPDDTTMGDIMSQRFRNEFIAQREAELERERKKKEANERAARDGRRAAKDRADIKANKAAQLRAIALADHVDTSPFDLWKMEKFTRSARPHLSTFRTGSGSGQGRKTGAGGRAGGCEEDDEGYGEFSGPCTCPDHAPYYGEAHDCNEEDSYRSPTVSKNQVYYIEDMAQSPEPISAL